MWSSRGPFAPGRTSVEIAYRMPFSSGDVSIDQKLPLAVPGLAVLMKKTGDTLTLASPQLPSVQEREFDSERYILAQGPTIPAGGTLTLNISGLPHRSPVPRQIALAIGRRDNRRRGLGRQRDGRRPAPMRRV